MCPFKGILAHAHIQKEKEEEEEEGPLNTKKDILRLHRHYCCL